MNCINGLDKQRIVKPLRQFVWNAIERKLAVNALALVSFNRLTRLDATSSSRIHRAAVRHHLIFVYHTYWFWRFRRSRTTTTTTRQSRDRDRKARKRRRWIDRERASEGAVLEPKWLNLHKNNTALSLSLWLSHTNLLTRASQLLTIYLSVYPSIRQLAERTHTLAHIYTYLLYSVL